MRRCGDATPGLLRTFGGTHTVTIAPRPVRGTFTVDERVYDGTTAVADSLITTRTLTTVTGETASGVVPGDAVALTGGAATFSSADAGERTVTLTGATLTGAGAANYTLHSTATTTATIARRPLTIGGSFTVADRPYDGSAVATIETDTLTLVGVVDGDTIALAPVAAFAAPSVGTALPVRLAGTTGLTGSQAPNYLLSLAGAPSATASITARALTVTGTFTVADKVYDGNASATIATRSLVLSGFASGDSAADISWTPTVRFRTSTAGTGRTVELVGGAVLGGAKGAGYVLDVTGAPTATATITPRPLTVTGASAAARPYDRTTAVTVSGATLVNTVAGDTVTLANATSGVAASRDAGTRAVTTAMTLTGSDAANYRLTAQPALEVTITPLGVSVTMNPLPARPYDGTTAVPLAASTFSVSGVLAGESVTVSGTGQLSSRAAGTRTVTLADPTFTPGGGTTLTNYVLPAAVSGTMTITPLPLRVVGASVTQRTWDGTASATVTGAVLEGVRAGDTVSLSGAGSATFASALPGTHAVSYAPTLIGVDAGNYTLSVPSLTGTIVRAPATLTITGGLTQIADGTPRTVRAAVSPASAGRVVITYGSGAAPSAAGQHPVSVSLDSTTHQATPLSATLTLQPIEALLPASLAATTATAAGAGADTEPDPAREAALREALLARIAVHANGTLALPEIGSVLESDGSTPALAPRVHRMLEDGEPATARITVIEDRRVLIERDDRGEGGFAVGLEASVGTGEQRISLPLAADGTLLLDRGGFVEVGGAGFLAGSTAEVWMFSTATFLGTAIVGADGTFEGAFLIDELLASGDHTIQLNGIGADEKVRSTSLGVRIDDPEQPSRERVVLASDTRPVRSAPLGLLALAGLIGAAGTAAVTAGVSSGRLRIRVRGAAIRQGRTTS